MHHIKRHRRPKNTHVIVLAAVGAMLDSVTRQSLSHTRSVRLHLAGLEGLIARRALGVMAKAGSSLLVNILGKDRRDAIIASDDIVVTLLSNVQ
jgi:hypothetical protein